MLLTTPKNFTSQKQENSGLSEGADLEEHVVLRIAFRLAKSNLIPQLFPALMLSQKDSCAHHQRPFCSARELKWG